MNNRLLLKFLKYTFIVSAAYFSIRLGDSLCDILNIPINFSKDTLQLILPIITTLLLIEVTYSIGERGNELQKHNLKTQLFDKRYKVFQSIIEANSLVSTKTEIISDVYKSDRLEVFNSQLTEHLNQLRDSELISKKLLNEDICNKMGTIVSQFENIRNDFIKLYKLNVKLQISLNNSEKLDIINMNNITNEKLENAKIKIKYQHDIMDLNSGWITWKDSVGIFSSFIQSSGILNDFDKYLIINDI